MSAQLNLPHLDRRWPIVTLDDIKAPSEGSLVGGPFGSELTSAHYVEMPGVPVIRGTNLDGKACNFIDDGFVFVSEEKANELARNLAFPGDVIFTQRGTLGQVAEIPSTARFKRYVISQSQMKLAVDPTKAVSRFVYHWYRSPLAQAHLVKNTLATGVPHINLGILKAFPIPLPPLEVQRRIVSVLDKADAVRRKRQEAIALTEQLLRSTFLEMFGDPVTNPRRWKTVALGESVGDDTCNGLSPSSKGEFPGRVLTLSAITRGPFDPSAVKEAMFDIEPPKEKMAGPDVFLVCRGNGNMNLVGAGRFGSPETADVLFPDTMIGLRVDASRFDRMFFEHIWQSSLVRAQIESGARTTNGTFKINQKVLLAVRVLEPPKELQQRFGSAAARLAQAPYRRASADSEILFNSLVQRAFSGHL